MTTLTSATNFTILAAAAYEETLDLTILVENPGQVARRELHYPGGDFPPIIYPDMPDRWENFDTSPLTSRPLTKAEMTLSGNKVGTWPGYLMDRPVREIWSGSENRARADLYFLRRLLEYFLNPPRVAGEYITWWPKDRTSQGYHIVLEDVSLGGQSVITLHYPAAAHDQAPGELVLTFRIVGEAG